MGILLKSSARCRAIFRLPFALVAFSIAANTAACGGVVIGDPSHEVYWANKSDGAVMIYKSSGTEKMFYARLVPGERKADSWLISKSTTVKRTVEAYDEAGLRVFCRQYNYQDLQEASWQIEVVKGQDDCR